MQSAQLSAERALGPSGDRRVQAEAWLGEVLEGWGVRSPAADRWLTAAQPALEHAGDLVIFAQYDPVLLLFSLELWRDGKRVYGIDDWLG